METNIAQITQRVRSWILSSGRPNTNIAEEAGVHEKTIRLAAHESWNPTVKTLGKLAAVVPEDFRVKSAKKRRGT